MAKRAVISLVFTGLLLGGCTGPTLPGSSFPQPLPKGDPSSKIAAASQAVRVGQYDEAEHLMADYVYRADDGALKLRTLALFGDDRKKAVDLIVMLLWETGRDNTLATFADDYLSRHDRNVMHCRLAERQARYQDAYHCWNDLGDVDRADRVTRTDAAVRILQR